MKYTVTGHTTVICSMVVEANTEKEAIEKANEQFGSLSNYTGMGGTDKMIGVPTSEDDRWIVMLNLMMYYHLQNNNTMNDCFHYVEEQSDYKICEEEWRGLIAY